jgi:membrane peptidoglycan carboxypeptidase
VDPFYRAIARSKVRAEISLARRAHRARWPRQASQDLRRLAIAILTVFVLVVTITAPVVAADIINPLPPVTNIAPTGLPQDLLLYDRHGNLLADIGKQGDHRIVVPLGAISPLMVEATIAIEDRTFYENSGIDLVAIGRAALDDLSHRQFVQGGSTITQQLAKELFLGPGAPATLQRKLREAILAIRLTQRYTKNQILESYLNIIYYGNQAYGVEAAARTYFHTSASKLTLAQASLLAGIPRAPSAYNPVLHPQAARQRQLEVLAAMVRQADITPTEAATAGAIPLALFPPANLVTASHFVDYVPAVLRQQFHITPGSGHGFRVVTSLDLTLQGEAESAVQAQIGGPGNYYNFHDAALVSMDPKTGEILAMVGGVTSNQSTGKINMAVSPTRQVGSAFKIFTYTAAIESRKLNMVSPILDAPLDFPIGGPNNTRYAPINYDGQWHGVLPLKMALGNSLNIPGIKTELWIGIPAVLDAARRMGVTTLTQPDGYYGPSLTLGAYPVPVLDMAVGASTLADMGVRHSPAAILSITDALGRNAYTYDPSQNAFPAVSPQVAFIMAAILSDDRNRCMEFGCGGDLTLPGRQVAAKTGTSQEFRDNWTLGFTPSLTTAVWVGNPDNTPLSHSSTGIVGAAPIWHQFMKTALQAVPNEWYPMPSGLDQIGNNYFLPGTENLRAALAAPWPVCPFQSYDPTTLSWSDILVNGVPCTLGSLQGMVGQRSEVHHRAQGPRTRDSRRHP